MKTLSIALTVSSVAFLFGGPRFALSASPHPEESNAELLAAASERLEQAQIRFDEAQAELREAQAIITRILASAAAKPNLGEPSNDGPKLTEAELIQRIAADFRMADASPEVRGARDAERDIQAGRPGVIAIGQMRVGVVIDEETGLPVRSMGCILSDDRKRYKDAYNAAIRAAIASGRIPAPGGK